MPKKRKKILLSWSGGKDSAVSLFELKSPEFELLGLLTTVYGSEGRVQMHDLPFELIEAQAQSAGLALHKVELPAEASNVVYEEKVAECLEALKEKEGLEGVAFGDVHLEELREYRERFLKELGLKAIFPLWGWENQLVTQAFSGLGHQAVVHCIDKMKIPPAFLGRAYNQSFVEDLPRGVDTIGENGEFHSFVHKGPFFQRDIPFTIVERYEKNGFMFQGLSLNKKLWEGHNRVN